MKLLLCKLFLLTSLFLQIANHAFAVELASPDEGLLSITPSQFNWTSEPAQRYQIIIRDATTKITLVNKRTSKTSFDTNIEFDLTRKYQWKVRAKIGGKWQAYTAWREFFFELLPTSVPSRPKTIRSSFSELLWEPIEGAIQYQVVISSDDLPKNIKAKVTDSVFVIEDPVALGYPDKPSVSWRVRAQNAAGWSKYSPWEYEFVHAENRYVSTTGQDPVNITLISDIAGEGIFNLLTLPTNGSLTGTPPNLRYIANDSFSGTDSFTYNTVVDGITSLTATVSIDVEAGLAPEISLISPNIAESYVNTQLIYFSAIFTDPSGIDLSEAITWISNIDGMFGEGTNFEAQLSPGNHVITLQVDDFSGETFDETFNIRVNENSLPLVTILSPSNATIFSQDEGINLSASALDVENGDLGESLVWTSSIDGVLGSGASISDLSGLTIGQHLITARVYDAFGAEGSAQIGISIVDDKIPSISIVSPVNNATISERTLITLNGASLDAEDGDISDSISWSSNINGPLGVGKTLVLPTGLSQGTHTITAQVVDSASNVATARLTLNSVRNSYPSITISSPVNDLTTYDSITTILSSVASDEEDGDISNRVSWNSSIDGPLGSGSRLERVLSAGDHVITASVFDSLGLVASVDVGVEVLSTPSESLLYIDKFLADSSIVVQGGDVKLSWMVEGADSVEISGVGPVNSQGSVSVSPDGFTTYTLTATSLLETKEVSLSVDVISELDEIFSISFPSESSTISGEFLQVLGQTNRAGSIVSNSREACIVGNEFVFTNLELPEEKNEIQTLYFEYLNTEASSYIKPLMINREQSPEDVTLIPSDLCPSIDKAIDFNLYSGLEKIQSATYSISGPRSMSGTLEDDLSFSVTFVEAGVYTVVATVNFSDQTSADITIPFGVQSLSDRANRVQHYNEYWSNFYADLNSNKPVLKYFHADSYDKYFDVLNVIRESTETVNSESSDLVELSSIEDKLREFVVMDLLDGEPQVYTVLFFGGRIAEL